MYIKIYGILKYTLWAATVALWKVKMTEKVEAELRGLLSEGVVLKSDVKVLLRW